MKGTKRACAAALAVLALLAVGAGSGAAATMSYSPNSGISLLSLGAITFRSTSWTIRCTFDLLGELDEGESPVTAGEQIGRVTEHWMWSCAGGRLTAVLTPIVGAALRYERTLGTLPNLIGLLVVVEDIGFQLETIFGACLYRGDLGLLAPLTRTAADTFSIGLLTPLPDALPLAARGLGCPAQVVLVGTYQLHPTQTVTFDL